MLFPNVSLTAVTLTMIAAPLGFAQAVSVTKGDGTTSVRVDSTNMSAKMPPQPSISPELAAAIKATMPTSATFPTIEKSAANVIVSVSAPMQTMRDGMAEPEQLTIDGVMDAAKAQAGAQIDASVPGAAAVRTNMRSTMPPKVKVASHDSNVRVDAGQTENTRIEETTAVPQPSAEPLAVDAQTFAKLQAMIPSAKGVISGSDMLVQAPTFILRVPVSRTEALHELHLTPESATDQPAQSNAPLPPTTSSAE
jgi:hypothetical protein